jgi:hypothetical protein
MKRPFKSHKLTANKKITRKPARFLFGERYTACLHMILSHRNPQQGHQRLFVFPLKNASELSEIWWSCEPMGKNTIGDITKKATKILHKAGHPLFNDTDRFTNGSLRKFHADRLMQANAPLIHQQASLAQNVRAYTDKRKQKKENGESTKLKIAKIVAGERKSWHSPETNHVNLSAPSVVDNATRKSLPFKKRLLEMAESTDTNDAPSGGGHSKQMCFTFSNASSNFSFCFDI